MNDVRTDGNSDRIYGAENTAKGVAEQVKKDKKRRLNVIEQNVSEFDRIGASCVGSRGDVEGELMDERGLERKGATDTDAVQKARRRRQRVAAGAP
jgi:hypothetical protein